jgi:hypothetical protein
MVGGWAHTAATRDCCVYGQARALSKCFEPHGADGLNSPDAHPSTTTHSCLLERRWVGPRQADRRRGLPFSCPASALPSPQPGEPSLQHEPEPAGAP